MKVTLLTHTPHALEVLLFTKNTRLRMSPAGLEEIAAWSEERKAQELEYMRHTIQSQFEFVDYVFCIEGVSRAFTHQLVRHRVGTSFAQQAQRAVDMTGFDYIIGPSLRDVSLSRYMGAMVDISDSYSTIIKAGANPQDARGILPTNISTNICFKANLRTLHDMAMKRLCVKAQGEFQDVFRAIRRAVIEVHPWAEKFIRVWCAVHGTCQFHSFPASDCPVKPMVYNPETATAYGGPDMTLIHPDEIQRIWETNRAEAQPRVPSPQEDTE